MGAVEIKKWIRTILLQHNLTIVQKSCYMFGSISVTFSLEYLMQDELSLDRPDFVCKAWRI